MHTTKSGQQIQIKDMTDSHLMNTIQLIQRKADSGIIVGYEGDDGFYVECLEEKEALQELGYKAYAKEAKKRGLLGGHRNG